MRSLQRIMDRAEKLLREQENHRRFLAQARKAEILGLVDAPPEELITPSRTVHEYDDTPDQAEGYEAALRRIGELYEDSERRWEAREWPGQVGSGPVAGRYVAQQ